MGAQIDLNHSVTLLSLVTLLLIPVISWAYLSLKLRLFLYRLQYLSIYDAVAATNHAVEI